MFKKIFVLALCGLMLVACNTSQVELLSFIDPDSDKLDYDGEVIQAFNTEDNIFAYKDDNTPQSEALWKRIADIEEKLNVEFEMVYDGENIIDLYTAQVAAGSLKTDLIYRSNGNNLWSLGKAGILLPITDFPQYIDLSDTDKYGMPGNLEAAMHNGIPYAVQPVQWPGLQGVECFVIAYNPDKFASNNLTGLHEYYENKTWTWDTMKNVFDTAAPSLGENDVLLEAHGGFLLNTLFISNGFDFVTFVDGEPTFDLTPQEALMAIDYLKDIYTYGEKIEIGTDTDDRWDYTTFIAGNALTVLTTAQAVTTEDIAYEANFAYNIMPFPCGPNVDYGRWAQSVTRIYGLAVTIGAEEPEVVAHVISELCEPFEEFGGSIDGLKEYYRNSVFTTDIDVEIYFAIDDYVRFDYDDVGMINEYTNVIAQNINKASAIELIQKNKNVAEQMYINYLEGNLKGYLIEHMNIE